MSEIILPNFGLSPDNDLGPKDDRDYILGTATETKKLILNPDRDYSASLPTAEMQFGHGFDTGSCVTFSALNTIETYVKARYNTDWNKADRFTAKMSGTTIYGNSFAVVAESIRKDGMVDEAQWPWTADVNTWDKYMAPIDPEIIALGKKNAATIDLKHEWVGFAGVDPEKLWQALLYGPQQVSVHTWGPIDANGVYQRMPGSDNIPTNHGVELFAGAYGKSWKIFDHYTKTIKTMAWDYYFGSSKQFFINLNPPMLQLIMGHEKPHVYATDLNGVRHYIYNMAQLRLGATIGLWDDEKNIKVKPQGQVDAMPEGAPIMLGVQ